MLSHAQTTGFSVNLNPPTEYSVEKPVIRAENPLEPNFRFGSFNTPSDQRDRKLSEAITKSINAYLVDGLVRQSVDKYTELFLDFHLEGKERQVSYITKRLNAFSLSTGESWKTWLSRLVHEYFKTGNAFFIKQRGGGPVAGRRPVYELKPYTLSGIFLISAERLAPVIEKTTGRSLGWGIQSKSAEQLYKLVSDGAVKLDATKAAIRFDNVVQQVDGKVLLPGVDIVHIAYKKGADSSYGVGLTFPALEDVSLLRAMEQCVAILIKKYSTPIIHHKVSQTASPLAGIQQEINRAASLYKSMSPEGVIVTSGAHEIKAIGSESQALRLGEYLKYFSSRAFSGLGTSPYIMGFDTATLGTAEAANDLLLSKVRFCQQEIARELETFLLNELLWEGGFDPYNEDDDVVKLVFDEVDKSRLIKMGSHAADLYAKNVITLMESREMMGRIEPPKKSELFVNQVQIPLEKAKAKAKGDAELAVVGLQMKANSMDDSVKKVLPKSKEELDDFVLLLERDFGLDRSVIYPQLEKIEGLIGDQEVLLKFVQYLLETNL